MAQHPNYLADRNPWQLQRPPQWFLDRMWEFDPQLVLMTSMKKAEWLLCRRWQNKLGLSFANDRESDTARMVEYRLLPISVIPHHYKWGLHFFQTLKQADIWAAGGADGYELAMQEQEKWLDDRLTLEMEDEAAMRAGSGYRGMKWRFGETIDLAPSAPDVPASPISPQASVEGSEASSNPPAAMADAPSAPSA